MCCIFTCCGWVIDLIQRVWTFAMSCVISSAICCVCLTSSMAGIALGYNYSLAEYIDLKETNVSVYMKRGVFDDAVVDDMQWRRSGHLPVAGHIGEDNLMTGAPNEDVAPLRSGRRLDNSIYEADDRNRFEGSLMKLTVKPPYITTPTTGITSDPEMRKIYDDNEHDRSPERIKTIQSLINLRKSELARETTNAATQKPAYIDPRYVPRYEDYPPGKNIDGRRIPHNDDSLYATKTPNPLREAVPQYKFKGNLNWMLPKLSTRTVHYSEYNEGVIDYDQKATYPRPVTPKGPIRPTQPSTWAWPTKTSSTFVTPQQIAGPKDQGMVVDKSMDAVKEKIIMNEFDAPNIKSDKTKDSKKPDDVYDYEARGLPVRRRRSVPISEAQLTYFTNRLQINNSHNETSSVASNVPLKNDNYGTKTDHNDSNNNAVKSHSGNYIIDKLVTFFYGNFDTSVSKNVTNTEENTDVTASLDAFKSLPVEVTRKELITKILRSRFLS